jgi:molecular chaperone GrpE
MSSKKDKGRRLESEAEKMQAVFPGQEEGAASEAVPEDTPLAVEEYQKLLADAQSQAAEYRDGWQRALADFQNYKRRTDAEKAEAYQNAIGTVVKRYLPILDDLERALSTRPVDQPWADGIELIYRKLQTILENEGLKRIEAEGQPFDPNIHEAISQEPAENVESGMVIGVIQQGYTLGERVIRPAMVRVAQ